MTLALAGATAATARETGPETAVGSAPDINGALADAPDLAQVLAPLEAELQASLGRILVTAPRGLAKGSGDDDALGRWVADTMLAAASASLGVPVQAALTNHGGLRRDLAPGPVRAEDLYEVLPFENQLVVAELTGAEMVQLVRETLRHPGGEAWAGLRITLEGTPDRPGLRVTWADGTPIRPTATYRLATSDYLVAVAGGGNGLPTLRAGRHLVTTGLTQRQLLLDACEQLARSHGQLLPPPTGRMRVDPGLAAALRAGSLRW
jgi:2',3'-cyclic-nucleotide 2'-phosphodiesterase (5'-nucleotidase family)